MLWLAGYPNSGAGQQEGPAGGAVAGAADGALRADLHPRAGSGLLLHLVQGQDQHRRHSQLAHCPLQKQVTPPHCIPHPTMEPAQTSPSPPPTPTDAYLLM